MIITIPEKTLPNEWLDSIRKYDSSCRLGPNVTKITDILIKKIYQEGEKSLENELLTLIIKMIVFDERILEYYEQIPLELIEGALSELNGERGVQLTRKLHSLFIELLTYYKLSKEGFAISDFTRGNGDCDLKMSKDGKEFNFEVKFKESDDIAVSRLRAYILGYSLLEKNAKLRGKKIKISLNEGLTDSNIASAYEELDTFIGNHASHLNGTFVKVRDLCKPRESRTMSELNSEISESSINKLNSEDIEKLIDRLFVGKGKHLDKLIAKSTRYNLEDNFTGYIVWSVPFHLEIEDSQAIKKSFESKKLPFDLWVDIGQEEVIKVLKTS